MSTFRDQENRKWELQIRVSSIKKVQEALDINLGTVLNGELTGINEVLGDPLKVVGVLYVLLEDQIVKRKLSEEDFADMLFGDTYGDANDALFEAITDFYPSRQGESLKTLMTKTKALQEKQLTALDNLDLDAYIESATKKPL